MNDGKFLVEIYLPYSEETNSHRVLHPSVSSMHSMTGQKSNAFVPHLNNSVEQSWEHSPINFYMQISISESVFLKALLW